MERRWHKVLLHQEVLLQMLHLNASVHLYDIAHRNFQFLLFRDVRLSPGKLDVFEEDPKD